MRIEKRTMGWIQKPTAYQYNQQLNARRKAQARTFMDQQALLSATIFAAQDNKSHGAVEIALKATMQKVQERAKAQLENIGDLASSLNKTV